MSKRVQVVVRTCAVTFESAVVDCQLQRGTRLTISNMFLVFKVELNGLIKHVLNMFKPCFAAMCRI